MHDTSPLRTVAALVIPVALVLAAAWLVFGPFAQDAVFAALKLAVTR